MQGVDIKLDVKIDINSGRCIFHNTTSSGTAGTKHSSSHHHHNHHNHHHQSSHHKQHQHQPSSQPQQHNRSSSTTSTGSTSSTLDSPTYQTNNYYDFENYMNSASEQQMNQNNKNTIFIFPAICVKAYYDESTRSELNNRLFKRANLYSIIKIEKFAMPGSQSGAQSTYYNRSSSMKEMVISPALLDFLEQTLEPLDTLLKQNAASGNINKGSLKTKPPNANANANSTNTNHRQRTVSFNKTTIVNTISTDNIYSSNKNNEPNVFHMNEDDDDDDNDIDYEFVIGDDENDKNETLKPSSFSSTNKKLKTNKRKKTPSTSSASTQLPPPPLTTIHFPIDFVVIISMLPSDIRFNCLPHSTMECLFKLPSIEMVFSSKSHRTIQSLQQQQSQQSSTDSNEGKNQISSHFFNIHSLTFNHRFIASFDTSTMKKKTKPNKIKSTTILIYLMN